MQGTCQPTILICRRGQLGVTLRLWSIHPKYLDAKGLVACWREALLAKAVLAGKTRGYRHHPQLLRFRAQAQPMAAINQYLRGLHEEALRRGYSFNARKIGRTDACSRVSVTKGQIRFEIEHLRRKLTKRDREYLRLIKKVKEPIPHPLFRIRSGPIEGWEAARSA